MIYKIHLLDDDRERKGEERECRPRVPTRSAPSQNWPRFFASSSMFLKDAICFCAANWLSSAERLPRLDIQRWDRACLEQIRTIDEIVCAIFLFFYWKTNFVTICKLCDWREKQKALDYIFEYFCCSFFFLMLKMYTLKKYRVYIFFNVNQNFNN